MKVIGKILLAVTVLTLAIGFIGVPRAIVELTLPDIARDLPNKLVELPQASTIFNDRLAEEFPPGTITENEIIERLTKLGFEVDSNRRGAKLVRPGSYFNCGRLYWTIAWEHETEFDVHGISAYTGFVEVRGQHYQNCGGVH